MKTLIIIAIILGVTFIFFVAKAEKSLIITGNEVMPTGLIAMPKMLLDKADEIKSRIFDSTGIKDNIVADAKNFISGSISKITETIKAPIEDKVNSILCPQK